MPVDVLLECGKKIDKETDMTQGYFSFELPEGISSAEEPEKRSFQIPMTHDWVKRLRLAASFHPTRGSKEVIAAYVASCSGSPTLEGLELFLIEFVRKGIQYVRWQRSVEAEEREHWLCRWPGSRAGNY